MDKMLSYIYDNYNNPIVKTYLSTIIFKLIDIKNFDKLRQVVKKFKHILTWIIKKCYNKYKPNKYLIILKQILPQEYYKLILNDDSFPKPNKISKNLFGVNVNDSLKYDVDLIKHIINDNNNNNPNDENYLTVDEFLCDPYSLYHKYHFIFLHRQLILRMNKHLFIKK